MTNTAAKFKQHRSGEAIRNYYNPDKVSHLAYFRDNSGSGLLYRRRLKHLGYGCTASHKWIRKKGTGD